MAAAAEDDSSATPMTGWYYTNRIDNSVAGPVSESALVRMVEDGNTRSSVWRSGMQGWISIVEAIGEDRAKLAQSSFFYADPPGSKGPVSLRDLRSLLEDGAVDGLTLIYHDSEWQQISQVKHLSEMLRGEDEVKKKKKKVRRRGFVADDGTAYAYDEDKAEWVERDDVYESSSSSSEGEEEVERPAKKKKTQRRKDGFVKNKNWIYVEGLPSDVTTEEIAAHFGKCGIIATDPESAMPKIKIYKDDEGIVKGDGAVCYANPTSVDMAVSILDGGSLRYGNVIKVTRADFSKQRLGEYDISKKRKVNSVKAKNAKKAQDQLSRWDADYDAEDTRKNDTLRILVVQYAFKFPDDSEEDVEKIQRMLLEEIIDDLLEPPEKITAFPRHPDGIFVVKTKTANDAHVVIHKLNGAPSFSTKMKNNDTMRCFFWDGVTNYQRVPGALPEKEEEEEEKRIDEFGDWVESQSADLPPELRLKVEE